MVKTHAPDVAQTVGPDLRSQSFRLGVEWIGLEVSLFVFAYKRIIFGNAVGEIARARVDVEAQDFAEKMMAALADVVRVVESAAIAKAQVKIAVMAEKEGAAIMIPIRLRNFEQNAFCGKICFVRIVL